MGPGLIRNNTDEKAKEYVACINNLFYLGPASHRFVKLLKDGRVICTDNISEGSIKIFKLIDNKLVQDLEFPKDIMNKFYSIFCEIDENIILFVDKSRKGLILVDIRDNNIKLIKEIKLDYMFCFEKIIKLSKGLIAAYNFNAIIFFIYDEKIHNIEKFDEILIESKSWVHGLWETNDGKVLAYIDDYLYVYDSDRKLQNKIKIDKKRSDAIDLNIESKPSPDVHYFDQYIFITYYEGMRNVDKFYIDVYSLKDSKIMQTLEVKYLLKIVIKLNDNLLVAGDENGNIHVFNIDQNFNLTQKEIFRAHEGNITSLCKFDDNKILSMSYDGYLKLWEIN